MKELLMEYAEYNVWANKLMIDAMLVQDEAAVDHEMPSSFPTMRATVYHTMGAEHIWLQRLQQVSPTTWLPNTFVGTFAEACNTWHAASRSLVEFVTQQTEESLRQNCAYADRTGAQHSTPVATILHHVFNHSTYHRGQLVTMLRNAGATTIPGTDFIKFAWDRQQH